MQFKEVQNFRQGWLWALLLVSFISTSASPLIELMDYKKTGVFHWQVLLLLAIPLLVFFMLWFMRMETEIDDTGIRYRFVFFGNKPKEILWQDVAAAYVRRYNPIMEYGGWGLRYSFKNGKAINVSGDKGLQLVTKANKKILIGTNKKDELMAFMDELYKKGVVSRGEDASNIKDRY